ncbi:hypothetical protein DPMN_012530 [Dreissena polymorpha]|uniref:Uncharacterized protein n=1 Tax=Dreissena polymorpha TaxID=45954 RepID=A0A9D4S107_DREPO|nr:hypothetical protein DPMN_012530 [Dreissena polymorpha]
MNNKLTAAGGLLRLLRQQIILTVKTMTTIKPTVTPTPIPTPFATTFSSEVGPSASLLLSVENPDLSPQEL